MDIDNDEININNKIDYSLWCKYHLEDQICDHCILKYIKFIEEDERMNHSDFIDDTPIDELENHWQNILLDNANHIKNNVYKLY